MVMIGIDATMASETDPMPQCVCRSCYISLREAGGTNAYTYDEAAGSIMLEYSQLRGPWGEEAKA